MTKIYISYYGDSISVVEGYYKKSKFNIDDVLFMSSSDIDPNYSDKYSLLKHVLKLKQYKKKDVVLCLNTTDVIVKSNKIPKVEPEDLDALMSMEIDELISLERNEYTFSYEVLKETNERGQEFLELILAGMETVEVNNIIDIFKEYNLNLQCIDILPAAYSRVLKQIEYTDMMIINTGESNTAIDIYKEDTLYIHDNVPVNLPKDSPYLEFMRLADEAGGLMNYYSSRNYGKIVDTILIIGVYAHNEDISQSFKSIFNNHVISGIDNLYDVASDIKGDILVEELNMIVDILGCMLRSEKSTYLSMNLLPEEMKKSIQNKKKLVKSLKVLPLVLISLYLPVLGLDLLNNKYTTVLTDTRAKIDQAKVEYEQVKSVEEEITINQEKINIYKMLEGKDAIGGLILDSIDKNIPFKVQLENLTLKYVDESTKTSEEDNTSKETTEDSKEQITPKEEVPVYERIPNTITLTGKAQTVSHAGQFVYNLKELSYFEDVKLLEVTEQTDKNSSISYNFSIVAKIKGGVAPNE